MTDYIEEQYNKFGEQVIYSRRHEHELRCIEFIISSHHVKGHIWEYLWIGFTDIYVYIWSKYSKGPSSNLKHGRKFITRSNIVHTSPYVWGGRFSAI